MYISDSEPLIQSGKGQYKGRSYKCGHTIKTRKKQKLSLISENWRVQMSLIESVFRSSSTSHINGQPWASITSVLPLLTYITLKVFRFFVWKLSLVTVTAAETVLRKARGFVWTTWIWCELSVNCGVGRVGNSSGSATLERRRSDSKLLRVFHEKEQYYVRK